MNEKIYKFNTPNFTVEVRALEDTDIDLSFDDDGTMAERLDDGSMVAFQVEARVMFTGGFGAPIELGADYLGGCIYESPKAFRDHLGVRQYERALSADHCRPIHVCSYFSSMVREAIRQARENMGRIKESANN
jgi:hypothetical protein